MGLNGHVEGYGGVNGHIDGVGFFGGTEEVSGGSEQ